MPSLLLEHMFQANLQKQHMLLFCTKKPGEEGLELYCVFKKASKSLLRFTLRTIYEKSKLPMKGLETSINYFFRNILIVCVHGTLPQHSFAPVHTPLKNFGDTCTNRTSAPGVPSHKLPVFLDVLIGRRGLWGQWSTCKASCSSELRNVCCSPCFLTFIIRNDVIFRPVRSVPNIRDVLLEQQCAFAFLWADIPKNSTLLCRWVSEIEGLRFNTVANHNRLCFTGMDRFQTDFSSVTATTSKHPWTTQVWFLLKSYFPRRCIEIHSTICASVLHVTCAAILWIPSLKVHGRI